MSHELANMRIPFFDTSETVLISLPPEGSKSGQTSTAEKIVGAHDKKITQREYRELQKRMLRHLEDLYGES